MLFSSSITVSFRVLPSLAVRELDQADCDLVFLWRIFSRRELGGDGVLGFLGYGFAGRK